MAIVIYSGSKLYKLNMQKEVFLSFVLFSLPNNFTWYPKFWISWGWKTHCFLYSHHLIHKFINLYWVTLVIFFLNKEVPSTYFFSTQAKYYNPLIIFIVPFPALLYPFWDRVSRTAFGILNVSAAKIYLASWYIGGFFPNHIINNFEHWICCHLYHSTWAVFLKLSTTTESLEEEEVPSISIISRSSFCWKCPLLPATIRPFRRRLREKKLIDYLRLGKSRFRSPFSHEEITIFQHNLPHWVVLRIKWRQEELCM